MAGIINSYSTLVSAVQEAFEDDSTEFNQYLPTAIGLAEDRIARELDAQFLIANTTVSVGANSKYVNKPSGYRLGHDIFIKTSAGSRKLLKKRDKSYLEVYWPHESQTAEPVYYGDLDDDQIMLAPTPEQDSWILFRYEKQPDKLTAAASTNAITEHYPNALYYGVLSEVAKFDKAWSQVQFWDAQYMEAMQAANNEGRRARRDGTEAPKNPTGVLNTFAEEGNS